MVGTGERSLAIADDRELQAILAKQACVPGSIKQTELSPAVTAYEVTCRGSGRVLAVRTFNRCRKRLKEALGVAPSSRTMALLDRISKRDEGDGGG